MIFKYFLIIGINPVITTVVNHNMSHNNPFLKSVEKNIDIPSKDNDNQNSKSTVITQPTSTKFSVIEVLILQIFLTVINYLIFEMISKTLFIIKFIRFIINLIINLLCILLNGSNIIYIYGLISIGFTSKF